MAWQTEFLNNNIPPFTGRFWDDNGTGMTTLNNGATNLPVRKMLFWPETNGATTYNSNKNYLFLTKVNAFTSRGGGGVPSGIDNLSSNRYLKILTPWAFDTTGNLSILQPNTGYFEYKTHTLAELPFFPPFNFPEDWRKDSRPLSEGDVTLQYFSSPSNIINPQNIVDVNSNSPGNTTTNAYRSPLGRPDLVTYESSFDEFGSAAFPNYYGTATIKEFKVVEMDWFVQGWALSSNQGDVGEADEIYSAGWKYDFTNDSFRFQPQRPIEFISAPPDGIPVDFDGQDAYSDRLPYGYYPGYFIFTYLGIDEQIPLPYQPCLTGFTSSNYISRFIPYASFNISFDADAGFSDDSYVDMYLIDSLGDNLKTNNITDFENILSGGQFLGKIDADGNYKYFGLKGNQYLLFRGNNDGFTQSGDWAYSTSILLSNFSIDGAYQENDNNEQFLFTETDLYEEPTELCVIGGSYDATYSVNVVNENTLHEVLTFSASVPPGTGVTLSELFGATGFPGYFSNLYGNIINLNSLKAKVGNGIFKQGIWENGVWNSGWRVDGDVQEFDDVEISKMMNTTNIRWRIKISGRKEVVSYFKVGDKVSIGNIVGIDINENRKLMTNYFTVLFVNIVGEGGFDNSIVVDFNNTFPLRRIEKDSDNHKIKITKNVWLNGGFLNGYFEGIWNNGLFKGFPYITEMYNTHWIDGRYDGGHFYGNYHESSFVDTYWWQENSPNTLGLTFGATAHGFVVGDKVNINMDDQNFNIHYNGESNVIAVVDDYMIVIDKQFGASSTSEGGLVSSRTGTAVIQNFDFIDNNVAPSTVLETSNLESVYSYNSWIDVKWLDESATNLGRSQTIYEFGFGKYSQNNLYGHITEDVLDSKSSFRNSYNLRNTIYSLGTKYEIYEDFLGDFSEFNDPFSSATGPSFPFGYQTRNFNGGLGTFINDGWTYSLSSGLSENELMLERNDSTESFQIDIIKETGSGSASGSFKLNNTNVTIEKKRYSMVEFDLLSFEGLTGGGNPQNPLNVYDGEKPSIYLLNTLDVAAVVPYKAFPDQEFVNHIQTNKTRKYEYFFNRRDLNILLLANGDLTTSMDNIKFYEIDKAPFFKYITDDYINKAVQIPFQGVAPFIDYEDNQFSFIDNIVIGLDSLSTESSYNDPSDNNDGESSGGGGGGS